MTYEPWPEASEIDQVFRKLIAEALKDVDTIQGVPHLLRAIPKDKAEVGSEKSRSVELFLNWLLTR